ncbi:MAG: PP0621 family protein [Acidiferrobacteraceae bacterium]
MDDILPIILILLVLFWFWRKSQTPRSPHAQSLPTEIVPCQQCGTYVPRTSAIRHLGQFYCSPDHVPGSRDKSP